MDLPVITVSPDEAKAKLAEYTEALRQERNAQDAAIAMAYRAAARGFQVIRLSEAVTRGGFFDSGLPRIAVVRAGEQECYARWDGDSIVYRAWQGARNLGALVGAETVRVPVKRPARWLWHEGRAVAPLIPPRHRPKPRRLRHCHVLWEVESWTPVPPRDPALIRHIRGDLWAVLAVWDLTDLERAVLF